MFANSQVFCCKVSSISQSCHIITMFENHSKKSHSQCLKITQQSLIHSVWKSLKKSHSLKKHCELIWNDETFLGFQTLWSTRSLVTRTKQKLSSQISLQLDQKSCICLSRNSSRGHLTMWGRKTCQEKKEASNFVLGPKSSLTLLHFNCDLVIEVCNVHRRVTS